MQQTPQTKPPTVKPPIVWSPVAPSILHEIQLKILVRKAKGRRTASETSPAKQREGFTVT